MTAQLTAPSRYRPVDPGLMPYMAFRRRREFTLAGGVWRQAPRRRARLRTWLLAAAAASALLWVAASGPVVRVPVTLSAVEVRDVPVYIESRATVQAHQTVLVRPQMDGQLTEVLFKEGQDLKAGEPLARIDSRALQVQYEEALSARVQDEAMLAQAKAELARLKGNHKPAAKGKKQPETRPDARAMEEKRAQIRQFEAALHADAVTMESLKNQINRSIILSPIDGRAGIRQVDAGNMVRTSDTSGIVVITQLEPISVVFDMPEKNLRVISERIMKKEPVQALAMDAENKAVLDQGTLQALDNQVDPVTGRIHLKATFPNRKRVLWPGGTVHVRLLVSSMKDAPVVPEGALRYETVKADAAPEDKAAAAAHPWVFVYDASNRRVEKRYVSVSMIQDGVAVIGSGVAKGESVVADGVAPLEDGSHVTTGAAAARE